MPILDIQKRARELGRIRLGQVVPATKRDGTPTTKPEKLDRFRLTSASRPLLEKVAQLYGGEVAEWQPQGGGPKAWEVVTTSTRLPIMVPPQPISQWYEYWTGGGCKHRCDGRTNVLTDELCDAEDFGHKEALKRPTTRLNVVLRDVEGIGVWRIETHGWNAAVELPDAAEFLATVGGYVNGWVSLEARTSKAEVEDRANGGTKIITRHFMVPIIEIDVTPAQLMAGEGRVATPQLEGPVPKPAELAGPDAYAPYFEALAAAETVESCQTMWSQMVAAHLVGTHAKATPRAAEFLAAFKAKGAELTTGAAPSGPAASGQPDDEGDDVVDGEIVPDTTEPDPDVVWQQILTAGGQQGMGLADLQDDFVARMGGLSSAEASGGELAAYLDMLTTGEAGAA